MFRLLILVSFFNCVSQTLFADTTNYFRSRSVFASDTTLVYDVPAWKQRLDGPVRASAAYGQGLVFIGTARGTMYAFEENTGNLRWKFDAGSAIHSTAAVENTRLYFITNKQELFCLDAITGKKIWSFVTGKRLDYAWRYDYWYSSPVISGNEIFVGSDDGKMYSISKLDGKIRWTYDAKSVIRSTPVFDAQKIYFGDCSGLLHAIDRQNGKLIWTSPTVGYTVNQDSFIYDRKAILSSVAWADTILVAGGRDGFLYGFGRSTGKKIWQQDFSHSWVNSTAVIKNKLVITGTSDGRFIGAFDLYSGKSKWKYETRNIVWSSPVIVGNNVYATDCDGVLQILDYRTGKKISEYRTVNAQINIFSSPVFTGRSMIFGTDEGDLYVLTAHQTNAEQKNKYVFWQKDPPFYFRNGMDQRVRDYYADNGFIPVDSARLVHLFDNGADSASRAVIAFATNYFPDTLMRGNEKSLLRSYLDNGGTLIVMGLNPAVYDFSSNSFRYNYTRIESIFGIHYGPDDLRSHHGIFPAFATQRGASAGLPAFTTALAPIESSEADIILSTDENNFASSWIKFYGTNKKGKLIQVYVDPRKPEDINYLKSIWQ